MTKPLYNFRLGPEAMWLILNAVIGTVLIEVIGTDFAAVTDWKAWAISFGIGVLGRTLPAAILAAATGGGFQMPGEPGPVTATADDPAVPDSPTRHIG